MVVESKWLKLMEEFMRNIDFLSKYILLIMFSLFDVILVIEGFKLYVYK